MGVKDITDGADIYQKLEPHEGEIKKMGIFQQKILLPSSKVIDTTNLDLSLYTFIIRLLDTAKEYPLIEKLRSMRNRLYHMSEGERDMLEEQFNDCWDQISQLLTDLGYNMNLLSSLKTDDHLSEGCLKDLQEGLHSMEGRQSL